MKTKYLFGALLGGALLAACSSDDVLDVSVAQKANPASPVFIAHFDDNSDTRATLGENGKVNFEPGDLLSLYHGVNAGETPTDDWSLATAKDFRGFENAVYEGGSSGDKFILTTRAYVKDGGAIMVYPADTADVNLWSTTDPIVTVPENQDDKTIELTPYISEMLEIGKYDKNEKVGVAGYNKEYDIYLKRVGGTLKLALNRTKNPNLPEDVDSLKITKVGFSGANNAVFVYKVKVAPKGSVNEKTWGDPNSENYREQWVNQTEVYRYSGDNSVGKTLTTTAISEDEVATFTMLPVVNTALRDGLEKLTVTISTTYGSVAIDETKEEVWTKAGSEPTTVVEGLKEVQTVLWGAETGKTSVFNGEVVGKYAPRTLDVDLSKLNMDGLHIKTEKQLIDAIKVLNKIPQTKTVTFYLDGDKENKQFVIETTDGLDALEAAAAYEDASGNKLVLSPCSGIEGEECEEIVLRSSAVNTNVPASLVFGAEVKVRLEVKKDTEGTWTLGEFASQNVKELVVADKATVDLAEVVRALKPGEDEPTIQDQDEIPTVIVEKGATVNASKTTAQEIILQLPLENEGTINVDGTYLTLKGYANSNGVLTLKNKLTIIDTKTFNGTSTKYKFEDLDDANEKVSRGKIYISDGGSMNTEDKSYAAIENYGYIKLNDDKASILLAKNGTNSQKITDPLSDTNIFGILDLGNLAGANSMTSIKENVGFVKSTNGFGTLVNYLIVNSSTGKVTDAGATDKYIELQQVEAGADLSNTGKWGAVIVPNAVTQLTVKAVTSGTSAPTISKLYLKGYIINANKNFKPAQNDFESYFGGNKEVDETHIRVTATQQ